MFKLETCSCIKIINCCNLELIITNYLNYGLCDKCNKELTYYDVIKCKLYLKINKLITESTQYDSTQYNDVVSKYEKLYEKIVKKSIKYSFMFIDINGINKLQLNEIILKFIDKNIYEWYLNNMNYYLSLA